MGANVTVTRTGPGAAQIRKRLASLADMDVLVGIPQKANSRRGGKINNAELLYVLTHGSPIRGIPATPVIEPAVKADGNRQAIGKELAEAASAHLQDNAAATEQHLDAAGMAGMNAAKAWFTDARNNWPPNKPSTIRRKGSSRRNIDTGALRRAITYVLRKVR